MLTKVCKTLLNQTLLQASCNQNKSRISVTDSSGLTAQMAEWYGASALGAVDLGFIPSQVKPVTLKLVFTASLLDAQHQREQCGEQAGKFTCCAVGKGT